MKSRLLTTTCVIILAMIAFSPMLNAQNDMRETGLRLGAFGSDFVFKKEKKPNKFRRYRAGINNLGVIGSDNFVASFSFGLAMEKRKSVGEDLWFISGLEPRLNFATIRDNSFLRLGIGYILGFQYDISGAFSINAEIIPSISTDIGDNADNTLVIDAAPNSSAAISVVYRFQKK